VEPALAEQQKYLKRALKQFPDDPALLERSRLSISMATQTGIGTVARAVIWSGMSASRNPAR